MEFVKSKVESLMGYQVTRYTANEGRFVIEASKKGVTIKGDIEFLEKPELQPFAKALSDAWVDHTAYLRKATKSLTQNLAGH